MFEAMQFNSLWLIDAMWQHKFGSILAQVITWCCQAMSTNDDVIKWKHFPRNWPFVREIHRSPVNFPRKGQWRGALMFSLIYAWINDWVNNREAGDLRRQHGHYDVIVMFPFVWLLGFCGVLSIYTKEILTSHKPALRSIIFFLGL